MASGARLDIAQELRDTAERLSLATDAAEIGLWDVDNVNDTLFWPPRVKAMFGISPHVPVTMADYYGGVHPEDRPATFAAYAAANDPERRALYDVEYRTIGKEDGVVRWVAAKGRGIFDDSGRCVRVIGTAIDITERKAAEERTRLLTRDLSERDLRLEAVFRNMSEGFALCEAIRSDDGRLVDYVILDMNAALQRMLGVGPEAIGSKLGEAPGDWSEWLAICDRVLRSGEPASFEYNSTVDDTWFEIRLNRVDEQRIAQLFFDVTARKQAEAHQTALLNELNHRVRNNLQIVSSLLAMQAAASAPETGDQLRRAIDRISVIAQIHGALYKGPQPERVDFAAYLSSLCSWLSESLIGRDDRISLSVEASSIELSIDTAIPLGMIVNELVTNAVKHAYPAPTRGAVSVRCHADAGGLRLRVSDSGVGLPSGEAPPGSGSLGMRLIKGLVAQVGGTLTVEGHSGTCFEVWAPT